MTSVACGAAHTLFLCQDGSVHGCGDATDGQLPCSKHELTSPPGRRDDDAACSYAEVVAASAPGRSPFAPGPYRPPMYPASRQVGVATPLVAPVPRRLRLTTLNPRVRFRVVCGSNTLNNLLVLVTLNIGYELPTTGTYTCGELHAGRRCMMLVLLECCRNASLRVHLCCTVSVNPAHKQITAFRSP